MKATFWLGILALVALEGCVTAPTSVSTTTPTMPYTTRQAPERIPIQNHAIPHEMWGAISASVGKDSP
jgi:hypothetical protein